MSTLQFIDSMTGQLAWPIAALILGLIFRGSLASLMNRVKRVRWGDREAELAEAADVQEAIEELAKPLPETAGEREHEQIIRIQNLVDSVARAGYRFGVERPNSNPPEAQIAWVDGRPEFQGLKIPWSKEAMDRYREQSKPS